jgi:RNA polymerase sigma factor FliA
VAHEPDSDGVRMMVTHMQTSFDNLDQSLCGGVGTQQVLILQHTSLVRRIALRLMRRMPHHVELDDLIQAGMVGLVEAARHHESAQDATFKRYAAIRIRGAMLDFMRRLNWTPRSLYRRLRDIEKSKRHLQSSTSMIPTCTDVASALGISLEQYHGALEDAAASQLMSLDDADDHGRPFHDKLVGGSPDPAEEAERDELLRLIDAALDLLPEKERVILLLHYDAGLLLREIGDQFNLSESRVCQLQQRAIERLRKIAQSWMRGRPTSLDSPQPSAPYRRAAAFRTRA